MVKTFGIKFGDYISQEKKRDLDKLDNLLKELEEAQTDQEKIETENKIKEEIFSNTIERKDVEEYPKPPHINEIEISTTKEVTHIALPGYEFIRGESLNQEDTEANSINRPTIDKQIAIQNVLINYFEINPNEIVVISESFIQRHLREKYHAYYAKIKETGILIVLNNQYGQAARIKNIETFENAKTQLALLIAMLENSDKRTMDEIQGFEAFDNIYTTQEDLERLYVQKINEHLETANQSNENTEDEFPDNESQEGKLIEAETSEEINETLIANQENIDLSGSAEDIWLRIKTKKIKTYNYDDKEIKTILNLINLSQSVIIKGKIESTPVRDIINAILELEEDKKITSHVRHNKGQANQLRVENARRLLEQKVIEGSLGDEAQEEYQKHLDEEIDLNGSAKDIWERIKRKTVKTTNFNGKQINSILDFFKISIAAILKGKIGSTKVRDIINAMLELEEEKKIGSQKYDEKTKRVKSAIESLKQKVLEGELGEEAQKQYKDYLEEEINLTGSAEDIWLQMKGKYIKREGFQDIKIETIQDFLNLPFTIIIKEKIGNTFIRKTFNAMLRLEGDKKITSNTNKNYGKLNQLRVENARRLLEQKVIEGGLGDEAQREMQTIVEAEKIQTEINKEIKEI